MSFRDKWAFAVFAGVLMIILAMSFDEFGTPSMWFFGVGWMTVVLGVVQLSNDD